MIIGYDIDNYNGECESGIFSATSEYAYRIIGVFKDVDGNSNDKYYVKLIKATSYTGGGSKVQWDADDSNAYANSELFSATLNGTNESYLATLTANKWNEPNNSYIAQPVWNVGGCSYADCRGTAKTAYTAEMIGTGKNNHTVRGTTYSGTNNTNKIGLMYVNDYAYATTSNYWTTELVTYNSEAANQDWLKLGSNEWTISRTAGNFYLVFVEAGFVSGWGATCSYAARPVLYLSSNVKIDIDNMSDSNMGTISNPYRITM